MLGFQVPGDLALTADGRSLVLTSGALLAQQSIRTGAQTFRGYWFWDATRGLPWLESVLVKNPDIRAVTQVFREFLAGSAGVVSVRSCVCSLDRVSRRLSVSFAVVCEDGSELTDAIEVAA